MGRKVVRQYPVERPKPFTPKQPDKGGVHKQGCVCELCQPEEYHDRSEG